MNRFKMLCVLCVLCGLLVLGGCRGVWMNAEYSQLLDHTAALSAETADRANQGKLTPEEMSEALNKQAGVWQKFRYARDGRAGQ